MNFDLLFVKYYDRLLFQLSMLLNDDRDLAEDMLHDVFLKMRKELAKDKDFDNEAGFVKWLQRVVKNHFIDYWRRKNRKHILKMASISPLLYVPDQTPTIEQEIVLKEAAAAAAKAVDQLRPNWQQVYKMYAVDGLKFTTIAEKTGRSIGAVLGEMRYARIKLKKELYN